MALALSVVSGRVKHCAPSSCGNLSITPPFRLRTDPAISGASMYELACENNRATLVTTVGKFFVENISGVNKTIRVVDASLDMNMCSVPQSSLIDDNGWSLCNTTMYVLKCNRPVNSSLYVDASAYINSSSSLYTYFFLFNSQARLNDFIESCIVQALFPFSLSNITNLSAYDFYHELLTGFELSTGWFYANDYLTYSNGITIWWQTIIDSTSALVMIPFYLSVNSFELLLQKGGDSRLLEGIYIKVLAITGAIILVRVLLGISILLAIIIYRFWRRHLSEDDAIEEFLKKTNQLHAYQVHLS